MLFHDDIARIEVTPADRMTLMRDPPAGEVSAFLKSFGFRFGTVDILGDHMESLNEGIGGSAVDVVPSQPIATKNAGEKV